MGKKNSFSASRIKISQLYPIICILITFFIFSNKTVQYSSAQSTQKKIFSDASNLKIFNLIFENVQYPSQAKDKEITGHFYVFIKIDVGGKIIEIKVNKNNNVMAPLVDEVVITGFSKYKLGKNKKHTGDVIKDLSMLENEALRVCKMLESLKIPEWQDKGMEFAIPFAFQLKY